MWTGQFRKKMNQNLLIRKQLKKICESFKKRIKFSPQKRILYFNLQEVRKKTWRKKSVWQEKQERHSKNHRAINK